MTRDQQQSGSTPSAAVPALNGATGGTLGWDRFVAPAMILWVFLACIFPTSDTDLWWQLRTGDYILEHHCVPFFDFYTFTDIDKTWVDLHWGFRIVSFAKRRDGRAARSQPVRFPTGPQAFRLSHALRAAVASYRHDRCGTRRTDAAEPLLLSE